MRPKLNLKKIIYALVIILSVAALALVAGSPGLMETKAVYQGF